MFDLTKNGKKMFTKNLICSTVLVAGGLLTQMSAMAAPFVLDFEGAGNFANINGFYNGGTDSQGNSGVNYGVQFGANTCRAVRLLRRTLA